MASEEYPQPDYSMVYNPKRHTIDVKINVQKIPEKFIDFDPSSTHLILNTSGFTKKLRLNVPYPDGRTVNTKAEVEASLEFGILRCSLPVTGSKPQNLSESDKNGSKKRSASDQGVKASEKPKKLKSTPAAAVVNSTTAASKTEKPIKRKKGKKFLEDKSAAMSLVDQLNDEEDRTRDEKLQKESEKAQFFKEKQQKKLAQKKKKEELRQNAIKELEQKQKSENAPAKSATPRKISFGGASAATAPAREKAKVPSATTKKEQQTETQKPAKHENKQLGSDGAKATKPKNAASTAPQKKLKK